MSRLLFGWFMVAGLGQSSFIRQYFPLFFMPERDLIMGGVLALVLGFVAGILPAIQAMRLRLADALRRDGVAVTSGGGTVVHLVGYGDDANDLSAGAAVTVAMDLPFVLALSRSPALVATYSSTQAAMGGARV